MTEKQSAESERKGFRLSWTEDTRKKFRILCLKRNTTANAEIEIIIRKEIDESSQKTTLKR